MDGKGYVKLVAAMGGAAIGWAFGRTVAAGIWAPVDSFWARGELAGNLLQWGGAILGAAVVFLIAQKAIGD